MYVTQTGIDENIKLKTFAPKKIIQQCYQSCNAGIIVFGRNVRNRRAWAKLISLARASLCYQNKYSRSLWGTIKFMAIFGYWTIRAAALLEQNESSWAAFENANITGCFSCCSSNLGTLHHSEGPRVISHGFLLDLMWQRHFCKQIWHDLDQIKSRRTTVFSRFTPFPISPCEVRLTASLPAKSIWAESFEHLGWPEKHLSSLNLRL